MKPPSIGILSFCFVGLFAVVLIVIGSPGNLVPPTSPPPVAAPPPSVAAGGFSLASTSVELPVDDQTYPAGLHADVVNANCAACHSASMVLTQPRLSADQWQAEITKMREVYKAPVAEADVPAIVAYLTAMSAALPGAPAGPGTSVSERR